MSNYEKDILKAKQAAIIEAASFIKYFSNKKIAKEINELKKYLIKKISSNA